MYGRAVNSPFEGGGFGFAKPGDVFIWAFPSENLGSRFRHSLFCETQKELRQMPQSLTQTAVGR